MKTKIAAAQILRSYDVQENLRALRRMIARARKDKADFLLTPEGCLSGYTSEFPVEETLKAVEAVERTAKRANLNLLLGTCMVEKRTDGKGTDRYNQVRVYDRRGRYQGFYAKTLLCTDPLRPGVGEMAAYVQGTPRVFQLDGLTFGCLICNDYWANPCCTTYPDIHLTQILAGLGAKVVFHAICSGGSGETCRAFHHENLLMRARASRLYVVTANAGYPDREVNAFSGIISPDGQWLRQADPQGEQYFCHTIEV